MAIATVLQWLFTPGGSIARNTSMRSLIAVEFFLSPKSSRWHLVRMEFSPPSGGVRPKFLSANYPAGDGLFRPETFDEGKLLGAMGRPATATVSFDIDEQGIPANLRVGAKSP